MENYKTDLADLETWENAVKVLLINMKTKSEVTGGGADGNMCVWYKKIKI